MKASDLRIGNLIEHNGEVHVVMRIHLFKVSTDWLDIDYALCYGIHITPQWLDRFGFDKQKDQTIFTISENSFEFKFIFYGTEIVEFYLDMVGIDLIYVHQLQNLYFALTGQELEPKS